MKIPWMLIAAIGLGGACTRETEEFPLDLALEYHPLTVGEVRLFAMDSIVFDPAPGGTKKDSTRLYAMEVVRDTFRGAGGGLIFRIERFERKDTLAPWQIRRVITESLDQRRLLRTEDNITQVKLVFPPKEGLRWNAFAFVAENRKVEVAGETLEMFKGWSPQIRQVQSPFAINGKSYPNTLETQLAAFDSKIELRNVNERYALNKGLVYREMYILDTQCIAACLNLTWTQKAEKGFILREWRLN